VAVTSSIKRVTASADTKVATRFAPDDERASLPDGWVVRLPAISGLALRQIRNVKEDDPIVDTDVVLASDTTELVIGAR